MTKAELMGLARQYARLYMTFDETQAKQALSDAIGAALKQARLDALEEAAEIAEIFEECSGGHIAIRALKEKPNV